MPSQQEIIGRFQLAYYIILVLFIIALISGFFSCNVFSLINILIVGGLLFLIKDYNKLGISAELPPPPTELPPPPLPTY